MALPTLNWHFSGWQAFSDSSDIVAVLDDIADWLNTATTDAHGSRTTGSGSAWSALKESSGGTIAIRLAPPASGGSPNQRIIIAGVGSGSHSPSMFGIDTFVTGSLIAGMVCEVTNEGNYTTFDNAAPYTSGTFSTYGRFGTTPSNFSSFGIIESQEAIAVLLRKTNNDIYPLVGGALTDPFSSSAGDAHTDGRRYSITICGTTPLNSATHTANNTNGILFSNKQNTADVTTKNILRELNDTWIGRSSFGFFSRNNTTNNDNTNISATDLKNESGSIGERIPLWLQAVGRHRQIFVVPDELCGSLVGNPAAYITLSSSATSQTDSFGFEI